MISCSFLFSSLDLKILQNFCKSVGIPLHQPSYSLRRRLTDLKSLSSANLARVAAGLEKSLTDLLLSSDFVDLLSVKKRRIIYKGQTNRYSRLDPLRGSPIRKREFVSLTRRACLWSDDESSSRE